jgi:hypothetical protein
VGGASVKALLAAAAILLAAAPAASADTVYGGSTVPANQRGTALISLVRHDDGSVAARASVPYACGRFSAPATIFRLRGTTDGTNVSLSRAVHWNGKRRLRLTLTGTFGPDAVNGTSKVSLGGCKTYTFPFALRPVSAPAGAPAAPGAGQMLFGTTGQTSGGLSLAVSLRVTGKGRIYAIWQANMRCGRSGPFDYPMADQTPSRAVEADGSFGGSETYTVRYSDHTQRYRVTFKGRLLADGATGTLRARMTYHDGKRRYPACASGTRTWTARA